MRGADHPRGGNRGREEGQDDLPEVILQYSDAIYRCKVDVDDEDLKNLMEDDYDEEQADRLFVKLNENQLVKLKMIRGYN